MGRVALQPEEITAFRARLAAVGARLFAERGFEGVTLRAVAAELGVSAMTPYRYVADKDELLALVRTEGFRVFADAQEAAAKGRGNAISQLRRLGRAYVDFAIAHPDEYRMMFELRQPHDAPADLGRQSARAFAPLRDAVARAVAEGSLEGDPMTLAHLLWATTHGLVTLHLADKLGMGKSLETLADEVLNAYRARGKSK